MIIFENVKISTWLINELARLNSDRLLRRYILTLEKLDIKYQYEENPSKRMHSFRIAQFHVFS